MTIDLPTPADRRSSRLHDLQALLEARHLLPALIGRLSAGLIQPDDATCDRWARWLRSLQQDPAWAIIEPALERPEAWPAVWRRARRAGFSAQTSHYQAIFFGRLTLRALDAGRLELAHTAWRRTLLNWQRLGPSDFFRQRLQELELDESTAHTVMASLLDAQLDRLLTIGQDALRLPKWDQAPQRRHLRLSQRCLQTSTDLLDVESPSPLEIALHNAAEERRQALYDAVADAYRSFLDALDLTTVSTDALISLVDGAITRFEGLGHPPKLAQAILRHTLQIVWSLRELKRDEEMVLLPPLLERLEPLVDLWRRGDRELPIELAGTLADVLVFKAEEALSIDVRQQALEDALQLCPGHRNASRLLSYLLLERASRELLKLSALPDATGRLDLTRRAITGPLKRTEEAVERAAELYPQNDLLDQYQSDLKAERQRFGPPPGDASDTEDPTDEESHE